MMYVKAWFGGIWSFMMPTISLTLVRWGGGKVTEKVETKCKPTDKISGVVLLATSTGPARTGPFQV
jgi:hypothetical protein